ncbi:MAG: hypothetical protein MPK09_06920 [Gammaproteobacteria bacterium]|nr:hypothetical protein [Gammaproteobacteria bacterium]
MREYSPRSPGPARPISRGDQPSSSITPVSSVTASTKEPPMRMKISVAMRNYPLVKVAKNAKKTAAAPKTPQPRGFWGRSGARASEIFLYNR